MNSKRLPEGDEKGSVNIMDRQEPHNPAFSYRPDIDGLRAVAVLSVLACHLNISAMAGGFVGVDVFFVISGYLISSIVFGQIAASRFSLAGFYERRIRRIFPALICMLCVFTICATIYFLPLELVSYSRSLIAAVASFSNFYFWRHSGYFDSPTSNPLLHTWSLAVEEQFYILFPAGLVLIHKLYPRRLLSTVVGLFGLSLVASAITVHYDRDTAFYMPYTRAWELLLGTMLSQKMFPRLRSVWHRNLATTAGALMIAYAVVSYSSATVFPGPSALIPCVGAALIIGTGESGKSLVGSVLSWKPVVFVGLMSYSLYLWHWPVIILHKMGILLPIGAVLPNRYASLIHISRYDAIIEILLSFGLAVCSWRFVERPFRSGSLRLTGRPLFAATGMVMAVVAAFTAWSVASGGFPQRFSHESVALASNLDANAAGKPMRAGICFMTTKNHFDDFNQDLCLHRETEKSNYLLLGDSHSAMLWAALSSTFPNVNIMQANASGCGPFIHSSGSPDCEKMMRYVFDQYLPTHPVSGLLLVARWRADQLNNLDKTLDWAQIHKVPVTIFGPMPEYDAPVPRLEAYSVAWKQPGLVNSHLIAGTQYLDEELQRRAAKWHVSYVSLYREICHAGGCIEYADAKRAVPLMFDDNHLSPGGSALIVRRLAESGELSLGTESATEMKTTF